MPRRSCAVILPLLLAACVSQEPADAPNPAPAAAPQGVVEVDEEIWRAALLAHREEKDEEYRTSLTSPMAGAQYLKSEPAAEVFLTQDGDSFELAYSDDPGAVLRVEKEQETWSWNARSDGVTCRTGDDEIECGSALETSATFQTGRFHLSFYPGDERVTFIVFDAERPEMLSFDHLLYFLADQEFAVSAHLDKFTEPNPLEVLTSRNLKKTLYRYARIRFQLDGIDQELTAFKYALDGEGSEILFIPFRDATTAIETYGGGRFLELEEPKQAIFLLDFNRAFNPLCNYSPAYNCAIPPRENHLEAPVRAGEKTYPHDLHSAGQT